MRKAVRSRNLWWGPVLVLTGILIWMPATSVWSDEGHGKEEPSTRSKAKEPKKEKAHGAEKAKPRGMPGMGMRGMPGMRGHGEERPLGNTGREKALSPLAARGKRLVMNLHCNACFTVE